MQKVFVDTRKLDDSARERCGLSEDIMMENAAAALEQAALRHIEEVHGPYLQRVAVLILCGGGNNGADGYALARRLHSHDVAVTVCRLMDAKSALCRLQQERAVRTGVRIIDFQELDYYIEETSIDLKLAVDCIFGSGFHGTLPLAATAVITAVNALDDVYRIACDVSSGIDMDGNIAGCAFMADETVTMGALKLCLYSDAAKDACGTVSVASLGISRSNFEQSPTAIRVLECSDLRLPHRFRRNVHKGSFGHVAVVAGEKPGAAVLAAETAFRFGAGLASLVSAQPLRATPFELMESITIPAGANVLALGMGLGRSEGAGKEAVDWLLRHPELPALVDADMCYSPLVHTLLHSRAESVVLTPHPKEFAALLAVCGLGEYTVPELCSRRVALMRRFCEAFPGAVLLLKGANVFIGCMDPSWSLFINPLGTNVLARGGSGDMLSGLVAALLAQGYDGTEAAIHASLAHALAAAAHSCDYSLTPQAFWQHVEELSSLNVTKNYHPPHSNFLKNDLS